jgi:hypothetical protein
MNETDLSSTKKEGLPAKLNEPKLSSYPYVIDGRLVSFSNENLIFVFYTCNSMYLQEC